MANIKSSQKRIEVAKRNTLRNKSRKSAIKTYIKKFEAAIEANELDQARELLKLVDKKLKQAESKNVIHKNRVASVTSRLAKKLNAANA
ncbi:30S ribosomal protein S20 [Anaerococcus sp. NML200574]|uniref:Small ribosomal subunit protein bS20 n=1 Tax=Anaerococcus kampingae TaxID=3115614 RepID=A0ABW9MB51_9FIRM|nr:MULTISPECIES: 30S ribosomal protein S20 [unclassified Anaerococcus]MCW6678562.1 30S ribosomal protein S20 [Anaerococcus sp. NML200574]MCW6701743.1 30S ribosomal protein S20 [Anaerococcus sp. NML200537]